jgi:hypothetical protein
MKWRSVFTFLPLLAFLYAYGDPAFDGLRPVALNEPFHELHTKLGSGVRDYWARVTRGALLLSATNR